MTFLLSLIHICSNGWNWQVIMTYTTSPCALCKERRRSHKSKSWSLSFDKNWSYFSPTFFLNIISLLIIQTFRFCSMNFRKWSIALSSYLVLPPRGLRSLNILNIVTETISHVIWTIIIKNSTSRPIQLLFHSLKWYIMCVSKQLWS